jgi:N-acetylglucosamine-6-phosphate deacetylase
MQLSGRLCLAGRLIDGWVEVQGSRIAEVSLSRPQPRLKEPPPIIAPGLFDLQVNGAGGFSVTDGATALDAIDAIQLEHGITGYLPTVITSADEEAERAVRSISERIHDPHSPVEGIHLEGPFLHPDHCGVHPQRLLRVPAEGVPEYYRDPGVRLVTLAPELPGAIELIRAVVSRDVTVSMGHTSIAETQAEVAVQAGASGVTHLFNAMNRFEHRQPNLPGWALMKQRLSITVIPDGYHVHPLVLAIMQRLVGGRVILITDATPLAATSASDGWMAGVKIRRRNGRVQTFDGKLAGSAMTLDEGLRRWIRYTDSPAPKAIVAASERPSRLVGIPQTLRAGAHANLVLLDDACQVLRVMRRGMWVN